MTARQLIAEAHKILKQMGVTVNSIEFQLDTNMVDNTETMVLLVFYDLREKTENFTTFMYSREEKYSLELLLEKLKVEAFRIFGKVKNEDLKLTQNSETKKYS